MDNSAKTTGDVTQTAVKRAKELTKSLIIKVRPFKVNLFILGARKSGTGAAWRYLTNDHRIVRGRTKEVDFFRRPGLYQKGEEWYHAQFMPRFKNLFDSETYYLDASPGYLTDPNVPRRIYSYNPAAKLIVLLREPVSRAYSAWNMAQQHHSLSLPEKQALVAEYVSGFGEERREQFEERLFADSFPTFEEMVEEELAVIRSGNYDHWKGIVRAGLYAEQISNFLEYFDSDDIFIGSARQLKHKTIGVLEDMYGFLETSSSELRKESFEPYNARQYPRQMSEGIEQRLREFYAPHNEELFELIGKEFDW